MIIVICVGENDNNLRQVLSQLQDLLDMFYNNRIVYWIVLNVSNSHPLNVSKLNNGIENGCKKLKKFHYIVCGYLEVAEVCKSINY